MIVHSMTYKEIYNDLATDKHKVDIKKEYLISKAVKTFRCAKKFPAWEIFDYKIPSTHNQYIIYFYAESCAYFDKPKVGSFCLLYDNHQRFVITWGASGYKHTSNRPMMGIRQINVYTSHFLQRYNERILKDDSLTPNEIACIYLSRNTDAMPIQLNEDINRNHEKYGENGRQAFRVRDGICFIHSAIEGIMSEDGDREKDKVNSICVIHKTFMNESEMAENQRAAIDKEHTSRWTECFEDLLKESTDGKITLRLEP